MIKLVAATLACAVLTIPQALAKPHNPVQDRHTIEFFAPASWHPTRFRAGYKAKAKRNKAKARQAKRASPRKVAMRQTRISPVILPHPAGCPRVRFCGCGASLKIFGKRIRSLYLAANWLKFPASEPGPMKIAAKRGHVFVILKDLGNSKVLAWDANSGGHKTRIHVRSLAGYSVRDPRGKIKLALR